MTDRHSIRQAIVDLLVLVTLCAGALGFVLNIAGSIVIASGGQPDYTALHACLGVAAVTMPLAVILGPSKRGKR